MRKLLVLILCCIALASGAKTTKTEFFVKSAILFAASDLTNINISEYSLFIDDDSIDTTDILKWEGQNLCEDKMFKKHIGDFNCNKPIKYTITGLDKATVILTKTGITNNKKSMVICTEEHETCDIIFKRPPVINKENLEAKGFIMDPNLKLNKK